MPVWPHIICETLSWREDDYYYDIILTDDHEEELCKLKNLLAKEFEIKDMKNLKYFPGKEITRSKKGIVISQWKYVLDLLKETGMLGASL